MFGLLVGGVMRWGLAVRGAARDCHLRGPLELALDQALADRADQLKRTCHKKAGYVIRCIALPREGLLAVWEGAYGLQSPEVPDRLVCINADYDMFSFTTSYRLSALRAFQSVKTLYKEGMS